MQQPCPTDRRMHYLILPKRSGRERSGRVCLILGLALPLLLSLASCGDDRTENALKRYYQALEAALDQPISVPHAPPNIGAFPRKRDLLLETTEIRAGLLDVYALRSCHITNLVARHNNQLGKVAPLSQQWLYELKLWRLLSECWQDEQVQKLAKEDRGRLAHLLEFKTRQLPTISYNALVGSDEWRSNFSRASTPLPPEDFSAVDEQLPALHYLTTAVQQQYDLNWEPESAILESHFERLQQRPLSAELLRTLMLATTVLNDSNTLLQRVAEPSSCPSDRPLALPEPPNWLEPLRERANTWFNAMETLLDAHVAGTPDFVLYRQTWLSPGSATSPLAHYEAVLAEHFQLRQQVTRICQPTFP